MEEGIEHRLEGWEWRRKKTEGEDDRTATKGGKTVELAGSRVVEVGAEVEMSASVTKSTTCRYEAQAAAHIMPAIR